jgi:hypothetical protein
MLAKIRQTARLPRDSADLSISCVVQQSKNISCLNNVNRVSPIQTYNRKRVQQRSILHVEIKREEPGMGVKARASVP